LLEELLAPPAADAASTVASATAPATDAAA